MRNYPKYIATMQDLLNAKEFDSERTKGVLQELINTKDTWLMQRKLKDDEVVVETDTIKVVESDKERYLYELKEDQNGPLFKLGFLSVTQAEEFLATM